MTARPSHRRGFTLLEVLLTMGIGSILLFVAVTMLSQAGNGYDRGSGSVAAEREARAVLTQMGEDFAKAEWHKDTILENDGEGWKRARLGFLSLQPDDAQSEDGRNGDLCAIHYYVKDIKVGNATVRCLMRGFRESGKVFPALAKGTFSTLFDEQDIDEPVAFGVLSFSEEPLVRDESGKWQTWHQTAPTDGSTSASSSDHPQAVRLRLIIARRELLGKLSTTQDWDGSSLRGDPKQASNNPNLESYEVIQRFGTND
ncbi:PulJ/GspJ family protein [Luteolibacter soli]|uniref:Prepilin-type N-terminal cleavage/methylation domain-containing protein n=1 Tax=Luteolibacter soli TaxID=3135280 RepID=A0ABU9AW08_9BACT